MAGTSGKVVVVGVDEAGYGPLLGPLVVSAAAFEVPRRVANACLWQTLAASVSADCAGKDGRVVIQDSKKLYQRKEGLGRLERSVLAVIGAWRGIPATTSELLGVISPEAIAYSTEYAWYQALDERLPRSADDGGVRIATSILNRDLEARGVSVAALMTEVLPEGHFNRLVASMQNKASASFTLVLKLIRRVAEKYPGSELRIFVDKQGGRDYYSELLAAAFPGRRMKIRQESSDESMYELADERTRWRVCFSVEGDSKHMPIAMASLLSKYVRELYMEKFNAYWTAQVQGLAPTAGYYGDGARFIREVEPHIARLGFARDQLVRMR